MCGGEGLAVLGEGIGSSLDGVMCIFPRHSSGRPQASGVSSRMIKSVFMSVSHYQDLGKKGIILCKSTIIFFR